jgi:multidrug resistance efflux pump
MNIFAGLFSLPRITGRGNRRLVPPVPSPAESQRFHSAGEGTGGTLGITLIAMLALAGAARGQSAPQTQPADSTVTTIATVEAFWSSEQYAKTSGYVSEVKHDMGDRVKKGDVLAVLHVPELDKNLIQAKAGVAARQQMKTAADAAVAQAQQALAVARSQLEGYKADLSLAQITLKRQEELSANKAATPQSLDDARARAQVMQANVGTGEARLGAAQADIAAAQANRDVAAAQVEVADAQVQEVQALLEYTRIIAPFDGVITRRQVDPGLLVQASTSSRAMPLFVVQQLDTVRVFCDVPENHAAEVISGAEADVKVLALAGQVMKGKITRISNAIDPASRTMRVEIDLPNADGALRPGMFAQVTIKLQGAPRVTGK